MKGVIFFIFLFVPGFFLFAQDYKTYTVSNAECEYTLEYPADWEVIEVRGNLKLLAPSNTLDKFQDSLMITVLNLKELNPDLEEFAKMRQEMLRQQLPSFELIDNGYIFIDGKKAFYCLYATKEEERPLRYQHYFLRHGENIYEVIYETKEEGFDLGIEVAEKIIHSLRIKR